MQRIRGVEIHINSLEFISKNILKMEISNERDEIRKINLK